MKLTLKFMLMFLAISIVSVPLIAEDESSRGSQVILDWDRFLKLWEEATRQPKPTEPDHPPMDYILSRSVYEATVKPHASEIRATFDLSVLEDKKWVKIPFLPGSLGLREAILDGKTVSVAQDNGNHALIIKGAGRHTLAVIFSVPTPDKDGSPQFNFPVVPTAMTLLSLIFPQPNLEVTVSPAQVLSSKTEGGKTYVQATIPPAGDIQISWLKKVAQGLELPSKIYSKLEQLVTVGESAITLRSQIAYSILHSGIDEIRLKIPENTTILGVEGGDVQNWKTETGKNGLILLIQFNRKVKGAQSITVNAEVPLKNEAALEVPILRTLGVEREDGAIGVEAKSNVEIDLKEMKGLRRVDVKELPQGLWSSAACPLLYGFTLTEGSSHLSLGIERHEGVPVLTSTIDGANAVTVLTKDGQWVTRVSFQVRNHLKQFIHLKVPEGAEIWSAFVSGQAVKPSKDKDGQILIPLEKSMVGNENASFPVEVIYHHKGADLSLLGNRNVFLPTVDLPISEMLWSLYVPEEFQFIHFAGNMDKERSARSILPVMGLAGQNFRLAHKIANQQGEKPASVDYLKSEIEERMDNDIDMAYVGRAKRFSGIVVQNQAVLESQTFARDEEATSLQNHVLPISFRIPEVGRLYRFGKIMVIGSVPQVGMTYVRSEIVTGFRYLLLAIFLGLLYGVRRHIREGLENAVRGIVYLKDIVSRRKESSTIA